MLGKEGRAAHTSDYVDHQLKSLILVERLEVLGGIIHNLVGTNVLPQAGQSCDGQHRLRG